MACCRYAGSAMRWLEVKALKVSRHGVELSSTPEHDPCTGIAFRTILSESHHIARLNLICRVLIRSLRISSIYHVKYIHSLLHTHLFCHGNRSKLFIKSLKKLEISIIPPPAPQMLLRPRLITMTMTVTLLSALARSGWSNSVSNFRCSLGHTQERPDT